METFRLVFIMTIITITFDIFRGNFAMFSTSSSVVLVLLHRRSDIFAHLLILVLSRFLYRNSVAILSPNITYFWNVKYTGLNSRSLFCLFVVLFPGFFLYWGFKALIVSDTSSSSDPWSLLEIRGSSFPSALPPFLLLLLFGLHSLE